MSNNTAAKPGDKASVTVAVAVAPQEAFRIFTEQIEVAVPFSASASGTTVTVVRRGWGDIRDDHPARHGLGVPAFIRMMGLWWGDLMTSLRVRAASEGMTMPTLWPPGAA